MANTYGKVSGTFEEIDNAYGKVSGVWKEADEIYGKVSGVWKLVFSAFEATSFATLSSGSGTFTVPAQANAIHIQAAVGGGGGAMIGALMIKQELNLQEQVVDLVHLYQIKYLVLHKVKL